MPIESPASPSSRVWAGLGLALTSGALLMLEVSLTRILSVVMWYHFAFFAISVALFGLASGGLVVYLLPHRFAGERAIERCATIALALALAAPLSFVLLAVNPSYRIFTSLGSPAGITLRLATLLAAAALYLTSAIPFVVGGLIGAIVFRRYGAAAGRLYAFDLTGAGLGSLATVPVLDQLGGPGAMWVVAALAALASAAFSAAARRRGRVTLGVALALVALSLGVTNPGTGLLHLRYFRGRELAGTRFEKWNSFSRVAVRDVGTPDSLLIEIDAASNTFVSRWDGRAPGLRPLRDGLIAVQYALEPQPKVLVIGSGGGVDLLTAVACGARSVTAVEVNPIIVGLMRHRLADFSGGIYLRPEMRIVTDEARSYIRRSHEHFDVIQAGYVDTYAATAAGAFSLTENTLYTREAYEDYLDHLTPGGIVSIQRYFEEPPQQSIRLVSLALAALERHGVADPARHVVVVRQGDRASVLVKRSPFTDREVARIEAHCAAARLELVAAPQRPGGGPYGELLATRDFRRVIERYPLDISPVADDRPFFFYVVKPTQFWRGLLVNSGERMNSRAVFLLTSLLFVSAALCALMLFAPGWARRAPRQPGILRALAYFGALGLGFMLVEVGMLQRLMLFLGHPALALSVVLTTLLLFAGVGSALVRGVPPEDSDRALAVRLVGIVALVVVCAAAWPPLFRALVGLERPWRVALAVVALAPIGLLLGTALPLGLRRLAVDHADLIPWAWAVNGATSVLGSVLAMVVAINNGFTATLLLGAAVYLVAWTLARFTRPRAGRTEASIRGTLEPAT